MNVNMQNIFLVISLIFMVIMYTEINNLKKNNLENFNNNIVEHMTDAEIDTKITEKIQQEYNYDLEAIRNLGAISKSLLTGRNYHNTDITEVEGGTVTIPGNVRILGNITVDGNSQIDGNLNTNGNANIGSAYIGSSKSHGGGFAEFSHKNNGNDSYSIIAAADGQLYLNTKDGKYIGFRHNNEQSLRIHPDIGHFHANGTINSDKNVHVKEHIKVDGNIHSGGTITSNKYMHLVNKEMKLFDDGGDTNSNIHAQRGGYGQGNLAPRGGLILGNSWEKNKKANGDPKHPNAGLFRFEKHSTPHGNPN